MNYTFRKATLSDLDSIWEILEGGIRRRREEGSNQWQDGYPNPEVIKSDIQNDAGYVLTHSDLVIGYVSVKINDEPAYADIQGTWLSQGDFVVAHRIAIATQHIGKGLSKKILNFVEEFATANAINSVKVDTNHDNIAMLNIFERTGYQYCGEVYFRGSPRLAFEKIIT